MEASDRPARQPTLTRFEYERARRQLEELQRVRDKDLPELLRVARSFVASDAAEEIAQIQDDQTVVDARIAHLESLIGQVRVVDDVEVAPDVVAPGRIVRVRYTRLDKDVAYVLGADPKGDTRAVSTRSPVGEALLGRSAGDVVTVELPNGRHEELHVLSVEPDPHKEAA